MEGKLYKINNIYALMVNGKMVASNDEDFQIDYAIKKLSLKNCQTIENDYDLMKLAEENSHKYYDVKTTDWHCNYNGFFSGFQKALEILGDKKFSEKDMSKAIRKAQIVKDGDETFDIDQIFGCTEVCTHNMEYGHTETEIIQSLQQTEWDVTFNPDEKDSDGCLILKRK